MTIKKETTKKYIGNVTETTINVFKTGKNKDLESNEVRKLYKEMTKKILKDDPKARLLVRVDNALQNKWTLKGFEDDDLDFEDYEEYFENRVKDTSKFSKFTNIAFVVQTENNMKQAFF
jgi:hypothetical protein